MVRMELSDDEARWLAYVLECEVEYIDDTVDEASDPAQERHRKQVYEDILAILEDE